MNPLQEYTDRPKRYFNIDGLGEIGLGLVVLGFVLIGCFQASLPSDSFWSGGYAFLLLATTLALLIHFGTKAVKERITYPRTGFVSYPWEKMNIMFRVLLGLACGAVIALIAVWIIRLKVMTPLIRPEFNRSSIMLVWGIIFAVIYAARIAARVRWKWAVALILACGPIAILTFWPGFDFEERWLPWGLFYGLTFLISGSISFYQYLKHTQPATRAAE